MKFLSLYILRSLGISIGLTLVAIYSLTMLPIPGRRGSVDRLAMSLILASIFFVLLMVTMPYLVYRKGAGKVTAGSALLSPSVRIEAPASSSAS